MAMRAALAMLILSCSLLSADAYLSFASKIPNGKNVQRNGKKWAGVGHENSFGGGARNAFGLAFNDAGKTWTMELCSADSDGDGQSNGLELGDPNCVWTEGAMPLRTTYISHPGFDDSTTVATADTADPAGGIKDAAVGRGAGAAALGAVGVAAVAAGLA